MQLVDLKGALRPVLKILTDYPRDDLAHDEVHQALVTACVQNDLVPYNIDVGAIPGLDTVTAGFKTAQLALNSKLGFGHVFHTNCAPRKNLVSVQSAGEKIVLGLTPSGVALLMVNAGYVLSPFYDLAREQGIVFYQTSVPDSGSQFRSRDYFPDAMASLAAHFVSCVAKYGAKEIQNKLSSGAYDDLVKGWTYAGERLSLKNIPQLPKGAVNYIDNFGNIKLNYLHKDLLSLYEPGTILTVRLGNTACEAIVGGVGFSQDEGVLALTSGSSGWQENFFTEIFLRGGRAAAQFQDFSVGDTVSAIAKDDLQEVIAVLQGLDSSAAARLDLHGVTEAKIIKMLSRLGLIKNGFDTTALKQALKTKVLESLLNDA